MVEDSSMKLELLKILLTALIASTTALFTVLALKGQIVSWTKEPQRAASRPIGFRQEIQTDGPKRVLFATRGWLTRVNRTLRISSGMAFLLERLTAWYEFSKRAFRTK